VPFRIGDTESLVGLGIGVAAALIGGDAAWRFVDGAMRAGGSELIVGLVVVIVVLGANVASVYVPFVGAVVLVLAALLALRLMRRAQAKHGGLRILR
jgi:hypothetical protein